MNARHSFVPAIAVAALITAGPITAPAQTTDRLVIESAGEQGQILACFYECKTDADNAWQETTTLVLANQSNSDVATNVLLFDGNQSLVAGVTTILSGEDLEEIHVCRALDQQAAAVPEAGLIVVALSQPGVYGWVKNVLGRLDRNLDDPFKGTVRDVAKTECRVVPTGAPGACPDLIVETIAVLDNDCPTGQGSCVLTADVTVTNIGDTNAGPFNLRTVFDPGQSVVVDTPFAAGLPAMSSDTVTVVTPPGNNCFDPDCTITATADSNDQVEECNENNNTFSATFLG